MCVKAFTPEYDICIAELAAATRELATGNAPAITWLIRGGCLQNLRDLAGATRDYTRAIERATELTSEQLAQVYDSRNVTRRQLKDYTGAMADGEQAVTLAPHKARYYTNLGCARMWGGALEEALTALNRALELDPEEYWAVGYRAMCYLWMGQYERAISDYTCILVISTNPSHSLLLNRARCYLSLEAYDAAIADCNEAARHAPDEDAEVYHVRGYAQFRRGNLDAAVADLSRSIGLRKGQAQLHLLRGLVFKAIGDNKAATDDFTEFARLQPEGLLSGLNILAQAMTTLPAIPVMSVA